MNKAHLAISAIILIFSFQHQSYGAGAYVVDDGGIVEKDTLQIENWYNQSSKGEKIFVINPAYQLLPNAEFSMQETYDERAVNVNTLWPQVKYLWHESKTVLSSAVVGVNYATSNSVGIYGSFFYVPTSFIINELVNINFDLGVQNWNSVNSNVSLAIGGVGIEYKINKKLLFIGEVFRNSNDYQLKISNRFSSNILTGAQLSFRYFLNKRIILDTIYGKDITATKANWATLGVTLLF